MITKKKIFLTSLLLIIQTAVYSQIKITASKNKYNSRKDVNGIFPVEVLINTDFNFQQIKIYRSDNTEDNFQLIKEIKKTDAQNENSQEDVEYNYKNNTITLYDSDDKQIVNHKYYYKAIVNTNDRTEESNIDYGYGALTPWKYFITMDSIVKYSHSKLILMNKKSNLEKLGKETANGDITGTLSYQTKVKGFSGLVIMEYINYSDNPYWILNGNTNTKANMSANGNMNGTVTITGMYPGTVSYDEVQIKSAEASGGTYNVKLPDLPLEKLDYTWTFFEENSK